jgi:O-phospho-L-seryl-tRNASec:L-selenocysteinyl-tRNA synthase
MINTADLQRLIPTTYVQQGLQNIKAREKLFQELLQKQRLPHHGWDEQTIESFIQQLSLMDSNNFSSNSGVGEREGRVFSSLVAKRHFYMSHGIGRSGDIVEVQPKAAGSSVLYKLTNRLAAHALHVAGLNKTVSCIVFPLATGMSLSLSMTALKAQQPPEKRYVLWSRIDQKSCFKSIFAAGLIPIVVENILVEGEMQTDVQTMAAILADRGQEILCVLSTTSCFAPRQPDQVDKIAELCKTYSVGHVINNAYGLQCDVICKQINRAMLKGRVDFSTSLFIVG